MGIIPSRRQSFRARLQLICPARSLANLSLLDAMTTYSHEQGLTPRKLELELELELEEIFYPPSLEL
jgi:hypothetical protein